MTFVFSQKYCLRINHNRGENPQEGNENILRFTDRPVHAFQRLPLSYPFALGYKTEASRCTAGIKDKGDNSCLPSRSGTVELLRTRSSWRRSDLNTSYSTADFLTQIEKVDFGRVYAYYPPPSSRMICPPA